jgi:hypothetical protein
MRFADIPLSLVVRPLVLALALATATNRAAAQSSPPTPLTSTYRARLLGVYSLQTGEAIEGAEVADVLSRTTALTTRTGTVTLSFLPDGGSLVRIQKIGYEPKTIMVAISPTDTVPFTILLSPIAQTLPTVVTKDSTTKYVSPGLRAFEERRKSGFGHFITEAELRKADNKALTTVIRDLPNINIACPRIPAPRAGDCWAVSGRQTSKGGIASGGSCALDLYVDGAVFTDNDLNKLRVDQFAAIEMYSGAATIPLLYNKTGSTCGVLLLWTRER